jgi:hypothetical protein
MGSCIPLLAANEKANLEGGRPTGQVLQTSTPLVLWVQYRGHDDPPGIVGVFDTNPETFFPQLHERAPNRPAVKVDDHRSDVRVVARQRQVLHDGEDLLRVRVALRVGPPRVDLPAVVSCHARVVPVDDPLMRWTSGLTGSPSIDPLNRKPGAPADRS